MLITKTYNNGVTKNYKKITDPGLLINYLTFQNQAPGEFYRKSCSKKFCKLYRKTPVLESLFTIGLQASNSIKKRLKQRCFRVNITNLLTARFLKSICEELLLVLNSSS